MATEPKYRPLGELCDPARGITYGIVKVGDFVPGGVPVIRGGDIRNGRIVFDDEKRVTEEISQQFQRTILRGGEIVINLIADPGHSAIVPPELAGANVSRDVGVISLNDTVDHRYVDYCLKSPMAVQWLTARLQGSVTQKINLRTLRDLPIPTPTLEAQRAIASTLGTLDDKIDLNRRMSQTLEAIARALFRSWFVAFDPVRLKAEGRVPDLPQSVVDSFPDSFADSELGEIPRGWTVGRIGDLASRILEKVEDSADWQREPLIDLSRMPQKSIALGQWGLGAELTTSVTRFRARDTLFGAIRPYFHKVGVAPIDGVTNVSVFVVRSKHEADWPFISMLSSMTDTVGYATRVAKGTKMPVISWADFENYPLPLPPASIRTAFALVAAPLLDRIASNIHESQALARTRDTLLPRLLSGALRVKGIERSISEAKP